MYLIMRAFRGKVEVIVCGCVGARQVLFIVVVDGVCEFLQGELCICLCVVMYVYLFVWISRSCEHVNLDYQGEKKRGRRKVKKQQQKARSKRKFNFALKMKFSLLVFFIAYGRICTVHTSPTLRTRRVSIAHSSYIFDQKCLVDKQDKDLSP